jgi:hypothetical protein
LGLHWLIVLLPIAVLMLLAAAAGDERDAFAASLGLCLVATPILWPHYLVLLYLPIALRQRRLGWLWLVPLALYVSPVPATTFRPSSLFQTALALLIVLVVCVPVHAAARPSRIGAGWAGRVARRVPRSAARAWR